MAKKKVIKKAAATDKNSVRKTIDPVVDAGRDIWLAGLGAFSMAQQEASNASSKVLQTGGKLFEQLVQEGSKLEKDTRKNVDVATDDIRGGIENSVDRVRKTASTNWDKLENVFEQRVAKALNRLGIPTAEEIDQLIKEVNKLSREVRNMNQAGETKKAVKSTKKVEAPKATTKKSAAKKAA